MKLTRIEIFNFRKLRRARLDMSDKQTLLVGANNSGKTSAMKALRKFLKDRGGIDTRDVTASNWAAIEQIAGAWTQEVEVDLSPLLAQLPFIDVWLHADTSELHHVAHLIKTLTIERHMAAARLGFSELFEPLSKPDKLKDGFRDGTLPAMRLFTHRILPLVTAQRNGDAFAAMAVLREGSPLVDKRDIRTGRAGQATGLDAARAGVAALMTLFEDERDPSCVEVLAVVAEHRLFPIPDQLRPCLPDDTSKVQHMADILAELGPFLDELDQAASEATPPTDTTITEAWTQALEAPFSQVARYLAYVEDLSPYGTHQGVKGLEFPRVMVIADDVHTRFKGLASYETLFGVKPLGPTAQKKADNGEETTIERTRRLLYVTCTRAEESLALVLYSEAPDTIRRFLISNHWMAEDEVVMAAADGTFQEAAQQC